MPSQLVRELLDAGIHFGHRVSRWNPKMKPYIFGKRNMIHIIDIKETLKGLFQAKKFLAKLVLDGKDVLFVGTKRQAKNAIEAQAKRCQMHYVSERWLGGALTNFQTIRSRLARLIELERLEETGELANYSKKMISNIQREKKKMKRNLDGMRRMAKLPGALVVIDVNHEHIAVREARKLGIPTICLVDTDGDVDYADIPIPGNEDSIRGIEIVLRELADAVLEGLAVRPEVQEPSGEVEQRIPSRPERPRRRSPQRTRPAPAGPARTQSQQRISPIAKTEVAPEPEAIEPVSDSETLAGSNMTVHDAQTPVVEPNPVPPAEPENG